MKFGNVSAGLCQDSHPTLSATISRSKSNRYRRNQSPHAANTCLSRRESRFGAHELSLISHIASREEDAGGRSTSHPRLRHHASWVWRSATGCTRTALATPLSSLFQQVDAVRIPSSPTFATLASLAVTLAGRVIRASRKGCPLLRAARRWTSASCKNRPGQPAKPSLPNQACDHQEAAFRLAFLSKEEWTWSVDRLAGVEAGRQ